MQRQRDDVLESEQDKKRLKLNDSRLEQNISDVGIDEINSGT
jgi:hypothetical protein